jgi:hypothetical protein
MTNETFTILKFGGYALGVCAAVAMLPGCSGSPMPISPQSLSSPSSQRNGATAAHPDHGQSWMAPDAKNQELLYISDIGTYDVYVYSYPKGELQGTLTGFSGPEGECVDKKGDIFIANFGASNTLEYAHGGTSPIATLSDPGYYPSGCSIDPTTGDLAVTNYQATGGGQGNVAIYQHAKDGQPVYYADRDIDTMAFGGYDNVGNLFVDGATSDSAFAFAELPSGGTSFEKISLSQKIGIAGGVQWDGTHVAVGDRDTNVIYEFAISGTKGEKVSSTSLIAASDVDQFWIEGPKVIGSDSGAADAMFWHYPSGGSRTKVVDGLHEPIGATVSKGE